MSKRQKVRTAGEATQPKGALHERVRQMLTLERLCTRFHLVATKLGSRHADRETLRVTDAYDVQDLLRALLTLEHDDIRPAAQEPGDAADGPCTDFLLKPEQIVLQAHMAGAGYGVQELAAQLAADIQKYVQHSDCRTLVCFVYDPERRIANPREVENDLSGDRDGLAVRVFIAPKGPRR